MLFRSTLSGVVKYCAPSKGVVTSFVISIHPWSGGVNPRASNRLHQFFRQGDRPALSALVAAAEQDNDHLTADRVVKPIARPIVDPHLAHSIADRLPVTEYAHSSPRNLRCLRSRLFIVVPNMSSNTYCTTGADAARTRALRTLILSAP